MRTSKQPLVALLLIIAFSRQASAQTVTNLHSFPEFSSGQNPNSGLIQGTDGYLYGTTFYGGNTNLIALGYGSIYRISPDGIFSNLYSFSGLDGLNPRAALTQGSDGNFYGTTWQGGTSMNISNTGGGTVFKITPNGTLTSLYSFTGGIDGGLPWAALVQGSDGNFYGTTWAGGTNSSRGTVFRISPSGDFTNLHSFGGGPSDGIGPYAALVQGPDGNFYGTTSEGGATQYGIVFRISPTGGFTNLHSFSISDGTQPHSALVLGSDGNFYGTTCLGGTHNYGTVFRMSPNGDLTNLYSFTIVNNQGNLNTTLIQACDGNFYGTTYSPGAVFRISPNGVFTNLIVLNQIYAPSNEVPLLGLNPMAGVVQASDGNFYGTTTSSALFSGGAIYEFSVPLSPAPWPINQITAVQPTGNKLVFNIPSVAGETYQLQFTSDLASGIWSNIPGVSVTNSIGALLTLTNFGGAVGPQGFYRFAITP